MHALVERFATAEGATDTAVPGLQLYRIAAPLQRTPAVYTPRICVNTQGAKRVFSSTGVHVYDRTHFICCTIPAPVQVHVPDASPDRPVMGVSIELETSPFLELIRAFAVTRGPGCDPQPKAPTPQGLATGLMSDRLEDAIRRLLALLDDPTACHALAQGRLTEVYFALLTGPLGPVIRRRFGPSQKIADSICFLQDHLTESVSIDQLARWAGMSRATFHRRFKETTGMAPIQFVKELRLNSAAMRLAEGMRTGEAAEAVGYHSPSQFSREFKRQFGQSPKDWATGSGSEMPVDSMSR